MKKEITKFDLLTWSEFKKVVPGKDHTIHIEYSVGDINIFYFNMGGLLAVRAEHPQVKKPIVNGYVNHSENGFEESRDYLVQKINEFWEKKDV